MAEKLKFRSRRGRSSVPLIGILESEHEFKTSRTPDAKNMYSHYKSAGTSRFANQVMMQTPYMNTGIDDDAFSPEAQIEQVFSQAIKKQYQARETEKHTSPKELAIMKKEELDRSPKKKAQALIALAKKRIGMDTKKHDKEYQFKKNLAKFKNIDTYFDVSDLMKKMAENPEKFEGLSPSKIEGNTTPVPTPQKLLNAEKDQSQNEADNQEETEEALNDVQRLRAQDKFRKAQERAKQFQIAMRNRPKATGPKAARVLQKVDMEGLTKALKEKIFRQKIKEQVELEIIEASKIKKKMRNSATFYNLKNYLEETEHIVANHEEPFDETIQKQYWDDPRSHLQDLYDNEIGGSIKAMPENVYEDNVTEYIQAIQSRIRKDLVREEQDLKITESLSNYKERSGKVINMLKTTTNYIYNMKWGNNQPQTKDKPQKLTLISEVSSRDQRASLDNKKLSKNTRQPSPNGDQSHISGFKSVDNDSEFEDQTRKSINVQQALEVIQDESPKASSRSSSRSKGMLSPTTQLRAIHKRNNSTALPASDNFMLKQEKTSLSKGLSRKPSMSMQQAEEEHLPDIHSPKLKIDIKKSEENLPISSPSKSAFKDTRAKMFFIDASTPEPKLTMQSDRFSSIATSRSSTMKQMSPQQNLLANIANAKNTSEFRSIALTFRRNSSGVLKPDQTYSVQSTPANKVSKRQLSPTLLNTATSALSFRTTAEHRKCMSHFQSKLEELEGDTAKLKKTTRRQIKKIDRTMDKMGNFYEKKYREYLIRCEKVPTSLLKPTADAREASKKRKQFADNLTKKLLNAVN